ncbi:MAG: branched-chain amino acid ABC transporter permease, partial [Pseudomonadota bacterium]
EVTGGDDGMVDIWPSAWASDTAVFFYLALVLSVGGILVLRHAAHAPFGYALRAARDSARQAEATGIDTKRVQWVAFAFAGAMAGLAGALFVFSKGSVFPNELEIAKSFDALIVVFLGGVKTLSGGVVGGAALEGMKDYFTRFEYWRLVLGITIILVVIVAPNGIVGSLRKAAERSGLVRNAEADQ